MAFTNPGTVCKRHQSNAASSVQTNSQPLHPLEDGVQNLRQGGFGGGLVDEILAGQKDVVHGTDSLRRYDMEISLRYTFMHTLSKVPSCTSHVFDVTAVSSALMICSCTPSSVLSTTKQRLVANEAINAFELCQTHHIVSTMRSTRRVASGNPSTSVSMLPVRWPYAMSFWSTNVFHIPSCILILIT